MQVKQAYLVDGKLYYLHISLSITQGNIESYQEGSMVISNDNEKAEHTTVTSHIPFLFSEENYKKLNKDVSNYVNNFFEELKKDGSV